MSNSIDDPTDGELIRRFQRGDRDALQELFDRHGALLRQFADRQLPRELRRRVSVADVIQETNLVALEHCEEFEERGAGSFRSWLFRLVELRVKEAVRTHARTARRAVRREAARDARPATNQLMGGGATPSQVAIGFETADIARRALAAIPKHYREVLRLHREEHVPLREVAERTGRSYDATKKRYGRALSAFTKEFGRLRGESLG